MTTVPTPTRVFDSLRTRLAGISAIPVTPFNGGGDIDELAAERVVRRIVHCGIEVVVACGNTSEQASLAEPEADQLTALAVGSSGDATVLAGVGGDLRSAISRAVRAVELGAAGIMIHYPTDPYVTEEGLAEYYVALAEATDGAVVLYLRGPGLSLRVLDRLAETPNVIAVKYAIPDALAFADISSRYGEAFVPICGLAELWAPFFWLAGAKGFTSGLANVAPRLSLAMLEALRKSDYTGVMELWRVLEPFERLRARHSNGNNVPVVKEAMELLGFINGSVRPPLAPLDEQDRSELARVVSGLRSWV